jgi:hypothetical protein
MWVEREGLVVSRSGAKTLRGIPYAKQLKIRMVEISIRYQVTSIRKEADDQIGVMNR